MKVCKQWAFPVAKVVKKSAFNAGDVSSIPGQEDPLEEEMATHSSILAWEIPRTEEPGRLQSRGSQKSWIRLATEHTINNVASGFPITQHLKQQHQHGGHSDGE